MILLAFSHYSVSIKGLNSKKADQLLQKHGFNSIESKEKKNLILSFLHEFKDLMIILLIVAALIAIFNDELVDGLVILAIVIINASISFFQQYRAEKALEALKSLVSPHAKVIRDGKAQLIKAELVVPGDIMLVESGDRIAADGIIIENNDLYIQESILTGESLPVEKSVYNEKTKPHKHQQVFMGTEVTHGFAKIEVKATGINTEFGRIAHLTQTTESTTSPLQHEIKDIGLFVTKITIVIATILFAVGYFFQSKNLVENLLFATSVAVAAVPEGLPATITIALALGVQRLAKKKAIVKQLSSAETLGSTSCIITDKTGTLTRNEMTVQRVVTPSHVYDISGSGYEPNGKVTHNNEPATKNKHLELIKLTSQYCHSTSISKDGKKYQVLGDPTEAALIVLGQKLGFQPTKTGFEMSKANPFDSTRKRMSVQISNGNQQYLLVKGAPESVLKDCTHYLDINGDSQKLEKHIKEKIITENNHMAADALRVLAIAYHERNNDTSETQLTFVGLVGILDPPREEVKAVIKKAKAAQIQIIVATGDNSLTARAIASQLGIISPDGTVLTHQDIANHSVEEIQKILQDNQEIIFARVTPEDKLKIVKAQQLNNKVVAMTGDGVNDAPALKQADIGVAMGITGTDVSKEAAKMILTNDKFTTIISAIQEGRNIYNNLRKIIFYLFSSNVGELVTIFIALLIGLPAPLTAILILLINVGTDALPAVALSLDNDSGDTLSQPPRAKTARILQKEFIIHVFSVGLFIGLIALGTFTSVLITNGWELGQSISSDLHQKAITAAFVSLIATQFFNAINAGNLNHSIFKMKLGQKKFLIFSAFITLPIVYLITIIPTLQNIFGTTALSPQIWASIFAISFLIIIIDELYKFVRRFKPKHV